MLLKCRENIYKIKNKIIFLLFENKYRLLSVV